MTATTPRKVVGVGTKESQTLGGCRKGRYSRTFEENELEQNQFQNLSTVVTRDWWGHRTHKEAKKTDPRRLYLSCPLIPPLLGPGVVVIPGKDSRRRVYFRRVPGLRSVGGGTTCIRGNLSTPRGRGERDGGTLFNDCHFLSSHSGRLIFCETG